MKEFLKKLLQFSMGPIVAAIIGFITVPITSHLVSADEMGLSSMYTIANNIVTLIALVGIDQAFVREYNENKDKKKLLFNSLLIPFIISIFVGIVLVIFSDSFARLLFSDSTAIKPVILLAFCTPLFIIEKFMLLSLRMEEKAVQYSTWNIISKLLNLMLTIMFLLFYKRNFEAIIYASVISQLIVSIMLMYICKKDLVISKKYIDKQQIKGLMKFGFPLIPSTLIGWGLNSMDSVFLRAMSTYTELGQYSVALKVTNVLGLLQTSFTTFWSPMAFKWKANGEHNDKFQLVSDGVTFVMSLILIVILLFKSIIPLFLGNGYDNVIYILPFLLFYPIFYTMSETTTLGISFSKKTFYNVIVSIIAMGSNLILNALLVPEYGAIGAASATGICYLVFFWTRTLISRNLWYKFDINRFIIITFILFISTLGNCIIKNDIIITVINIISLIIITVTYKDIIYKLVNYKKEKRII